MRGRTNRCARPGRGERPDRRSPGAEGPKRVVVAITGNAPALSNKLNRNNSVQGVDALETLVNAGGFDGYVDGRPKIDSLEVRFINDGNTMVANILAGTVEMYIGRGLSIEQGITARDRWSGGRLEAVPAGAINLWPQLLAADPQVITDLQFRRAMVHAMNLPEITDILTAGMGNPLQSFVKPSDLEYIDVQPSVVRYLYDPSKTIDMISGRIE